jgi:hypothetical protein
VKALMCFVPSIGDVEMLATLKGEREASSLGAGFKSQRGARIRSNGS